MNSTQSFIVALVTILTPVILLLIPLFVKLIYSIGTERLTKIKIILEANREYIADVIKFAQATFKQMGGKAKLDWVLAVVAETVNLPEEQLKILVESILAELKKDFAEEWEKLGETTSTPSFLPTESSETISLPTP